MLDVSKVPTQYYHHGPFKFSGGEIPDAVTAYRTYGDPSNPCIIFPTCYGGRLDGQGLVSQDYMVGEDKVFNPQKYFVVTFALFSNGESSSPSNTPAPHNGVNFPAVSYEDNIHAQYAVLTKKLGVKRIYCAAGFSMGAQQAYHWAVIYPEFVERIVTLCGTARTTQHNKCFLEGAKSSVFNSKDFNDGKYTAKPETAIRVYARILAAWVYNQSYFRAGLHLQDYPDIKTFLDGGWEQALIKWDLNDLLVLCDTWYNGDISQVKDNGDLEKTLQNITAKALVFPAKTDLFFTPEDCTYEHSHLGNKESKLRIIDTIWGHMAGGGVDKTDDDFVQNEIRNFLES